MTLGIVPGADSWVVRTTSDRTVERAALLLSLPGAESLPRLTDGDGSVATVIRHGREFVELTVDIPAGDAAWTLAR